MKHTQKIAQWVLTLFVVTLPWQTRWIALPGSLNGGHWEYGTVSLYATDFLLLTLVALGLVLRPRTGRLSDSGILALALLLITFVSLGEVHNHVSGLFWFAQMCKGVLLFFAITWIRPRAIWMARAWVVSGLVQALLVHWQFAVQSVWGNKWLGMAAQDPALLGVTVIEVAGSRWLRAYGSLPHPNIAGMFLSLALVLSVVLTARAKTWHARFAFGAVTLVTASALWLTYSRQAWIAACVMLGALALHTFWTHTRFPQALALTLLLALTPALVWTGIYPELTQTRLGATERIEVQSLEERQEHQALGTKIIQNNWVTGVGIGNYTAYLYTQDDSKPSYAYQPVHNVYLLILAELGVAGILAFVLFLISLFIKPPKNDWAILWRITLLGLIVTGLFDHYLWSLPVGLTLFWLLAGLCASRTPHHQNN